MRTAADRLGISVQEVLSLLATYCPPPAKKPAARPAPPPSAPAPSHPAGRKRVDVAQAWRAAESGSTAARIAASMGFGRSAVEKALLREAVKRRCLPPTATAPRPQTTTEIVWDLVHVNGLDVRTAARRLGLKPPAILALLAEQAPIVREREWLELGLAGEAADGRSDWLQQRHAHLLSRVRVLRKQGIGQEVIAERLGLHDWQIRGLLDEVRRSP